MFYLFSFPARDEKRFLPEDLNIDHLRLCDEQVLSGTYRVLDTFDWRLFGNGLNLFWDNGWLVLANRSDGAVIRQIPAENPPASPDQLPSGPLKSRLAELVEVRALLSMGELDLDQRRWALEDEEEKIHLRLTEAIPANGNAPFLLVESLRGYSESAELVLNQLLERGYRQLSSGLAEMAFANGGKTPGDYSGKVLVDLGAQLPAPIAVRRVMAHLLETARRNEKGLLEDLDIEFLHDFRVATRRMRVLMGHFAGYLPEDLGGRLAEDMKLIGSATNRLRDLDVYLHHADEYVAMLPANLRDDILPLFQFLKRVRIAALNEVKRRLKDPEYHRTMEYWQSVAQREETPAQMTDPAISIGEAASQKIGKRHRQILKQGRAITPDSPDEALHKLRLSCKKLRYLLEFFAPLYEAGDLKKVLKAMRRLQNNLGRFNDLCVQIDTLMIFARDLHLPDMEKQQTHLAIGCLIGQLRSEKEVRRREFSEIFQAFEKQVGKADFSRALRLKEEAQS